jgi:hypothetical protein
MKQDDRINDKAPHTLKSVTALKSRKGQG